MKEDQKTNAKCILFQALYGNAKQIPILDDPLLYLAEGGALLKGIVKGVGKIFTRQAAKKSAEVIVKEVAELGENKIHHILQEHHMWGKVVSDPTDWGQFSAVMSRTMIYGVKDETVVVTYTKLSNGTIKISDGWVAQ